MNSRLFYLGIILILILTPSTMAKKITQQEINNLFDLVDHNNDNRISRGEWKWGDAWFNALDRNKNGILKKAEVK